ncbi:MAG: glycosyltransferase family 2 protein [Patescibacteria group bacterium]
MIRSLSIFFPCYNDKGTVNKLIDDSIATVSQLGIDDYEIIVIDDVSTDGARELLRSLSGHVPRLKVIFHDKNYGYGRVLKSGFAIASKEWVFYTDGDAQYDIKELTSLAAAAAAGVDWVNGYKIKRQDTLKRIIMGKIYKWVTKAIFFIKIKDVECNFRLIRRAKMNGLTLTNDSGSVCVELVKKLQMVKAVTREVPVHHYARIYGHSQFFTIKRVMVMLVTLSQLWWRLVILRQLN